MKRVGTMLVAAAIWCTTTVPESAAARKKARLGVFGTINGKNFKATNLGRADDPCVMGIYQPNDGILVFSAIECRARRRRQGAVRRNYKVLVLGCSKFSSGTPVPPYEIPCPGSGYTETKTGRFRLPVSMTEWQSNSDFSDLFMPTSNLRMRIDAFDGTTVRGAFFGVFDVLGPGASAPAPINGEVRFEFPFRIQ